MITKSNGKTDVKVKLRTPESPGYKNGAKTTQATLPKSSDSDYKVYIRMFRKFYEAC